MPALLTADEDPNKWETLWPASDQPFGAMPVWKNPELDESWTPGPPPTTPPEHLEDNEEREHMAMARKEAE